MNCKSVGDNRFSFLFFFHVEGLPAFEEDGMPKEDKLPENSENLPLNPESSFNPDSMNPISVPDTSSSALAGTSSSPQGSHQEVRFPMPMESEGIFKNSDFQSMYLSFPLRFPCPITSLESLSHWRKFQIEEVSSLPLHFTIRAKPLEMLNLPLYGLPLLLE